MKYLVRVWFVEGKRLPVTEYHEFFDLEESKEYADRAVRKFRENGCEFDVMIYEATNY